MDTSNNELNINKQITTNHSPHDQGLHKRLRGRPKKPVPVIQPPKPEKPLPSQPEEYIFALDIGTRTVIGIVGAYTGNTFVVTDYEIMEHPGRAMFDGQVEDIAQVGSLINEVKRRLEERMRFKLERVAIAAAGRLLHTIRAKASRTIEPRDLADKGVVLGLEGEALELAQAEMTKISDQPAGGFYCVGYSIVEYRMDGAPITQLLGHICSEASVELIAAFLPNSVVEGLYSAVDMSELEVVSLTLEPIAAMNVLIPPELRLLNLALVDIGAGTSDIAVCREGVIYSYEMATIAGDEITEEILRQYLVDFETAERMKRALSVEGITTIAYENILGAKGEVGRDALYEGVKPVVKKLAKMISEKIVECNGASPAAVFLIGGGSQAPGLAEMLAECLNIDVGNIAVGARRALKSVEYAAFPYLAGPEFITPIGIAVTALTQECFHFFGVTVNGKRLKLLNTDRVRCMDVLFMAGYRTYQIIGQSGRNLIFTLNGQTKVIKGSLPEHATLTINGKPGSVENDVRPGDVLNFKSACNGEPASATLRDIWNGMCLSESSRGSVTLDGKEMIIGTIIEVNGTPERLDYEIKQKDNVVMRSIRNLADIAEMTGIEERYFYKGAEVPYDMPLLSGMEMVSELKHESDLGPKAGAGAETEETGNTIGVSVMLNDEPVTIDVPGGHLLLMHLLERANVNTKEPEGKLCMLVNGSAAGFTSIINPGDDVRIEWLLPDESI